MKKLDVILMVAAVTAGAVVTTLWLDLRDERGKAAEIATRLTTAESTQTQTQTPAPAMPVVAATSPQPAARAADSPLQGMLDAMTTPEGRDATRNMMRKDLTRLYPDIEQELGITAQEKQKLFELLSDEDQDFSEMMLAMQDPAATREMQRKMAAAESAQDAKVSALLGSRYPNWEEYQGKVAARAEVDQLRRLLDTSGNPLSESQSKQLVTAFTDESNRSRKDIREWSHTSAAINSPGFMKEMMQREEDSRKRMVDVASPILNSAQLERYKRNAEQESTMMRATMEMMTGGGKP